MLNVCARDEENCHCFENYPAIELCASGKVLDVFFYIFLKGSIRLISQRKLSQKTQFLFHFWSSHDIIFFFFSSTISFYSTSCVLCRCYSDFMVPHMCETMSLSSPNVTYRKSLWYFPKNLKIVLKPNNLLWSHSGVRFWLTYIFALSVLDEEKTKILQLKLFENSEY